jgi:hypothetical protein
MSQQPPPDEPSRLATGGLIEQRDRPVLTDELAAPTLAHPSRRTEQGHKVELHLQLLPSVADFIERAFRDERPINSVLAEYIRDRRRVSREG